MRDSPRLYHTGRDWGAGSYAFVLLFDQHLNSDGDAGPLQQRRYVRMRCDVDRRRHLEVGNKVCVAADVNWVYLTVHNGDSKSVLRSYINYV